VAYAVDAARCRGDSEYYRQLGAANNTNMEAARAGRARKKAERDKAKQEDKT
jgi:hypothetical protein